METIRTRARWRRLLTGFVMVFAVFQGLATSLGSTRGEYGLIVAAVVVGMTIGVELGVFEAGLGDAIRGLGLGAPRLRGIVAGVIVGSLVMVAPLAVLVHLWLFVTMPWPIAMASVLLAVIISFPLAHLFELGGRTIWAPAIVHFAVQAIAKLVVVEGSGSTAFYPLAVMASSALIPLAAFLRRPPRQTDEQVSAVRDVL